jgi:hypothetical protein
MFENVHMYICSAREYAMFAPAEFLGNWREMRPSNEGNLDSNITGEVGSVYYTGMDTLLISFMYRSKCLLLSCF